MNSGFVLPEDFQKTIEVEFGNDGKHWLKEIPEIIRACEKKWGIKNLKTHPKLSYNYIGFATINTSPVVLKIGFPHKELWTEMAYLKHFHKNIHCVNMIDE